MSSRPVGVNGQFLRRTTTARKQFEYVAATTESERMVRVLCSVDQYREGLRTRDTAGGSRRPRGGGGGQGRGRVSYCTACGCMYSSIVVCSEETYDPDDEEYRPEEEDEYPHLPHSVTIHTFLTQSPTVPHVVLETRSRGTQIATILYQDRDGPHHHLVPLCCQVQSIHAGASREPNQFDPTPMTRTTDGDVGSAKHDGNHKLPAIPTLSPQTKPKINHPQPP